ncbi:hypothetical protein RDI58_000377 [Solanum bulbocastanum]|uniref:RING-type E3 ubiquitin transferase n=1 Tax=Solanum bulbocastanum TaxID=147425 RepID=A0AAN8U1B1_SOLBU
MLRTTASFHRNKLPAASPCLGRDKLGIKVVHVMGSLQVVSVEMTIFFLLYLLFIMMVLLAMVGDGAYDCRESRCGSYGPSIHFPFRLRHQPEYCGYPGFELSCDRENQTILKLPNSLILSVGGN